MSRNVTNVPTGKISRENIIQDNEYAVQRALNSGGFTSINRYGTYESGNAISGYHNTGINKSKDVSGLRQPMPIQNINSPIYKSNLLGIEQKGGALLKNKIKYTNYRAIPTTDKYNQQGTSYLERLGQMNHKMYYGNVHNKGTTTLAQ